MTYVITQSCCNDAVCIDVCPVDCIHPSPASPEYATTEQLYIDPASCIECDACFEVCPVEAIYPDVDLPEPMRRYVQINADYYAGR